MMLFKYKWQLTLVLVLVLFWIVPVQAFDAQQKYYNTTGQTAYDLTKILYGNWTITNAIHDKFNNDTVTHEIGGLFTVIHWDNGSVAPGEWTWGCFNTSVGDSAPVVCAYWTNQNGMFIGMAAPSARVSHETDSGSVVVEIGNDWREWTGTGWPIQPGDTLGPPVGTIAGTDVYYTITDHLRPLEDLNDSLISELTWTSLSNFQLNYGENASYNLGAIPSGDVVLFRFELAGAGLSMLEMVQFEVVSTTIPTLPEWGLIILTMLLLATAVWLMRKRRVNMTPA